MQMVHSFNLLNVGHSCSDGPGLDISLYFHYKHNFKLSYISFLFWSWLSLCNDLAFTMSTYTRRMNGHFSERNHMISRLFKRPSRRILIIGLPLLLIIQLHAVMLVQALRSFRLDGDIVLRRGRSADHPTTIDTIMFLKCSNTEYLCSIFAHRRDIWLVTCSPKNDVQHSGRSAGYLV